MTVIIPYTGNQPGLAQLLVSLQPQLHPDDDIYIIDMSKEKSAKTIALWYGSTRCYIFVEPTDKPWVQSIEYGLESMRQNKQNGALIISPQCVVSTTFIANLKKATQTGYDLLYPDTHELFHGQDTRMDSEFKWFGKPMPEIREIKNEEEFKELSNAVYYMTATPSRLVRTGLFVNEMVVILPDTKTPL